MVAKPIAELGSLFQESMWVDGEPDTSPLVLDFRPVMELMASLEYSEREIDRWIIESNHANHELLGKVELDAEGALWITPMLRLEGTGDEAECLIDPYQQQVHIYRPGVTPHVIDNPETISGDPELPGFVFEVRRRIFDRENEPR